MVHPQGSGIGRRCLSGKGGNDYERPPDGREAESGLVEGRARLRRIVDAHVKELPAYASCSPSSVTVDPVSHAFDPPSFFVSTCSSSTGRLRS